MIKAIVVIALMVIVNSFMIFAIVKASSRLNDSLRRYFVAKVGNMDSKAVKMRKAMDDDTIFNSEETEEVSKAFAEKSTEGDYFDAYGNVNGKAGKENPYSGYGGKENQPAKEKEKQDPSSLYSYFGANGKGMNFNIDSLNRGKRAKVIHDKSVGTIPVAEDTHSARYKHDSLKKDYQTIKQLSFLDRNEAINVVKTAQTGNFSKEENTIFSILQILDFDTAYSLSSMESQRQIALLSECLSQEQMQIVLDYAKNCGKSFSSIDFYGYMQNISMLSDPNFYLLTSTPAELQFSYGTDIQNKYDPEIAEGIKIVYKNKMYDYSI